MRKLVFKKQFEVVFHVMKLVVFQHSAEILIGMNQTVWTISFFFISGNFADFIQVSKICSKFDNYRYLSIFFIGDIDLDLYELTSNQYVLDVSAINWFNILGVYE